MPAPYNSEVYREQGTGALVVTGRQAVTQITDITTAVTVDALAGEITTVSQTVAGGAEAAFTVNNSRVRATDVVVVCIQTHTSAGEFLAAVSAVADGSFQVRLTNLHATVAGDDVLVLNFVVLKCEA